MWTLVPSFFSSKLKVTSNRLITLVVFYSEGRYEPWHTTAIKERMDNDPRKLKTVTGSVYILQTDINEKAMLQNGIYILYLFLR